MFEGLEVMDSKEFTLKWKEKLDKWNENVHKNHTSKA